MCSASVDLIPYNWMEIQADPVPDFVAKGKCRDFGALKRWQMETGIGVGR